MVTVLDRQSLFDLAIQALGSSEAAFSLALANDLSLTDNLEVGRELVLTEAANNAIADYYENKGLKPATAATNLQFSEILGEGIDFMGIEIDFIIS